MQNFGQNLPPTSPKRGVGVISLLSFLYVTTPLGIGLIDGGKEAGVVGVFVGLCVGLFVAISSVFGLRTLVHWIVCLEKKHPIFAKPFIFSAYLWILVSGLLAGYITKLVLNYVTA